MENQTNNNYERPELNVFEVAVEHGIATSPGQQGAKSESYHYGGEF